MKVTEKIVVQDSQQERPEEAISELSDIQLAFVGGGSGEVVFH
jgi:hypothetical protein